MAYPPDPVETRETKAPPFTVAVAGCKCSGCERIRMAYPNPEVTRQHFPLYEMLVQGNPEWHTIREAGRIYDSGWVRVELTGNVLDGPGQVRRITTQEKILISDIADEWSASK